MLYAASASQVRSGSWMRAGSVSFSSSRYVRAREDALLRIEAVGDAHAVGGLGGQHHQAAHAGGRGRERVPVRFLEAERREQAPVDAGDLLRLLEHAADSAAAPLRVRSRKFAMSIWFEALDVAVVALQQLPQRAVVADAQEELCARWFMTSRIAVLGEHPGERLLVADGKGARQVRIEVAHHVEAVESVTT